MRECLLKFGVPESNIFSLMDPSEHATNNVYIDLVEKLKKGANKDPPVNYFVMHCFSGAGVQIKGMQSVLFNEFDDSLGAPHIFEAEYLLKKIAEDFPNSYHIGVFTSQRGQTSLPKCTRKPANTPRHLQQRASEAKTDKYASKSSSESLSNSNHERSRFNHTQNVGHARTNSAHDELDKSRCNF